MIRNKNFFWAIIVLLSTGLISCKDDDDNTPSITPDPQAYGFVAGPEGASFDITYYDGTTVAVGGTNVTPASGQLLDLDYYRQFMIGTDSATFFFRISIPKDTASDDAVNKEHWLSTYRLNLQDTGGMTQVYSEFYSISGSPFNDNAEGTIKISRNVSTHLGVYSVIGEVDATFGAFSSQPTTVKGFFWAEDFPW